MKAIPPEHKPIRRFPLSLQPRTVFQIPVETQRVARAAFPQSTLGLRIADGLGPIYEAERFVDLFPPRGQPAEAPGRLAGVTVLQFVENLSDGIVKLTKIRLEISGKVVNFSYK